MTGWERRLIEDSLETRAELERRGIQGDADSNLGYFNFARNFIGQYLVLFLLLVVMMLIILAIFVFSRVSPADLHQVYLEQRELVRNEQASSDGDYSQ